MNVRYYVAGRLLLESLEDCPPRRGDEVCFDDRTYEAVRVVRHMLMCPPDTVNVHLRLTQPEGA